MEEYASRCLADFQQESGIDQDFEITFLDVKGVNHSGFCVFKAESPEMDLVFKGDINNADPARFQREILTQRRLFNVFEPHENLSVPRVRHSSRKLRYYVMDFAHGSGMQFAVRNHVSPADEDRVFRQAGRWLGVFHRMRAAEMQPFDPNERAQQLLARLKKPSAKKTIYRSELLESYARKMVEMIPDYQGLPNPICLCHGDFHADNLVFDGDRCTGLDFFNVKRMSAGSDIARIMVHADLAQFEEDARIGPLGLVQNHVDAFFSGYGFDLPEKHPISYLIRQRLLEMWSRITLPSSEKHTQYDLLRRLEGRAKIAFA